MTLKKESIIMRVRKNDRESEAYVMDIRFEKENI